MPTTAIPTRLLSGFDDPAFGRESWQRLLEDSGSDNIYLTWHYQRAWWETLGGGELLLIAAERAGRVVALAPLCGRSGMIYFNGAGYFEVDYLDFIGDTSDSAV